MQSPENELKPCPFGCVSLVQCYETENGKYTVGCGACGTHSGHCITQEMAIELWNTRCEPPLDKVKLKEIIASIALGYLSDSQENLIVGRIYDEFGKPALRLPENLTHESEE